MTTEQKQKLKVALCGYLPWGVKCMLNDEGRFNLDSEFGNPYQVYESMDIVYINPETFEFELQHNSGWGVGLIELSEFNPILYPISCLTKEIVVKGYNDGKPFVPIERIMSLRGWDTFGFINNPEEPKDYIICVSEMLENKVYLNFSNYLDLPFFIIDLLNKWKIDYEELIPQGLAIDVETLEINPYLP